MGIFNKKKGETVIPEKPIPQFGSYKIDGKAENNKTRANQMVYLWDTYINGKEAIRNILCDAFLETAREKIKETGFDPLVDDLDLYCVQRVVSQYDHNATERIQLHTLNYIRNSANQQLAKLQLLDEMKEITAKTCSNNLEKVKNYEMMESINVAAKRLMEERKVRMQNSKEEREKEE